MEERETFPVAPIEQDLHPDYGGLIISAHGTISHTRGDFQLDSEHKYCNGAKVVGEGITSFFL